MCVYKIPHTVLIASILFSACFGASHANAQTFVVTSDSASFVDQIGGTQVIETVRSGTKMYAIERQDGWIKAASPNQQIPGWVSRQDLKLIKTPQAVSQQIRALLEQETTFDQLSKSPEFSGQQVKQIAKWANDFVTLRGQQHPVSATLLNSAGNMVLRAKAFQEAEKMFKQALAINEAVYGKQSTQVASSHLKLADLYVLTGDLADTGKHAKASAMINARYFELDHPNVVRAYHSMGDALLATSNYESAIDFYQKALAGFNKHLGEDSADSIFERTRIARAHIDSGNPADAIKMYRINERVFKENSGKFGPEQLAAAQLNIQALQCDPTNQQSIRETMSSIADFKRNFPAQIATAENIERGLIESMLATGRRSARHSAFLHSTTSCRTFALGCDRNCGVFNQTNRRAT